MNIQYRDESIDKCHPLLRELNICDSVKENLELNEKKTEDFVSSYDVLSFLVDNGFIPKDSIRNAVRKMRQQRQIMKENRKNTRNDTASVALIDKDTSPKNINKEDIPKVAPKSPSITPHTKASDNNIRTRHIALRFFYDGASYSGLAQNVGQENDKSIERCLFDALKKARLIESRETSNYSRCGRTDRGVSSAGQVVALHLKSAFPGNATWDESGKSVLEAKDLPKNESESRKVWTIPRSKKRKNQSKNDDMNENSKENPKANRVEREIHEYSYAQILNNILPPSIRILGWTPVSEEFSARFSAASRTYRYFFCKRQMNLDAIREGLKRLVGRHDFRNLCKMDVEKVYNFERTIHSAELIELQDTPMVSKDRGLCYLKIIGQAFLWHQIRCIAEVIFMIGKGFESPTIITELVDVNKHPRKPSYALADEKPLVLHDCAYPNLRFGYSVQNLWNVSCQLEKQWEELTLAAARIHSGIQSLHSCSVFAEDITTFFNNKLAERRKKLERRGVYEVLQSDKQNMIDNSKISSRIISWGDGLSWLEEYNFVPCPDGLTNSVHVPLLKRSFGPTYEEKVQNLKKSEKRRKRFEDNIIKKRKTAEEDKAFYDHKIKQGGTGI